jgi:hypothetical protein
VLLFLKAHEPAGFGYGDGDAEFFEHIDKHSCRAHAAVIDGRSGPVENHRLHVTRVSGVGGNCVHESFSYFEWLG